MDDQWPVVLVGAGGHARVVAAALKAAGRRVRCVLDDDATLVGSDVLGVPVVGVPADGAIPCGTAAVLTVGDNAARQRLATRLKLVRFVPVTHPRAFIDPDAAVGAGTVLMAGAVVQPGVTIGSHAIINTGATVDHDCRIGDFAHVAPGANLAGWVEVGEGALVGVGASVRDRVRIGAWAIVGAGAAVVSDVPDGATAVGVPARVIRQ